MKVAILGANGFVGGRLFERWQQSGLHQPRAIVRSPSSLARIARFSAEWRLADARDAVALTDAFRGCEAVVHCVAGDANVIADTVEPFVRAAHAAGVAKLVYLSTAVVHGASPPPGTSEASMLRNDQPLAYNNAKVRAECRLQSLVGAGPFHAVILRPGIVFGPRSRWVADLADALRQGTAHWIDGGRGICNSIYIDNLVHAVECALAVDGMQGEPFVVGDREEVTWRDFYAGIAAGLGYDASAFVEAVPSTPRDRTWLERLDALRASRAAQRLIAQVPSAPKAAVKAAWASLRPLPSKDAWSLPAPAAVTVATLEMSLLFSCRTKLPHTKAAEQLGYAPPVSFAEGIRRSIGWLRQLGLDLPA